MQGRLTPWNLEISQWEIRVVIIQLPGPFRRVTQMGKYGRSVPWGRDFPRRHGNLSIVSPFPAIDRELRALGIGGGIDVYMMGASWWLW
jgi:hypothetical protein